MFSNGMRPVIAPLTVARNAESVARSATEPPDGSAPRTASWYAAIDSGVGLGGSGGAIGCVSVGLLFVRIFGAVSVVGCGSGSFGGRVGMTTTGGLGIGSGTGLGA